MPHKTPLFAVTTAIAEQPCPCGRQGSLALCCLPFITGSQRAPTAEALMRSRYSAHVIQAIDYLWRTWSPSERNRSSPAEIRVWAASCEWLGLHILSTQRGQAEDNWGIVEFIAHYRQQGQLHQHHEKSRFERSDQGWCYINHQE